MLPRMGAKLEEKILRSIAHYRQSAGRLLLSQAGELASELVAYLSAEKGIKRVLPAGSLRRGKETVGDIDLLVTGERAEAALDRFLAHPSVTEALGKGPSKASARFGTEGVQVDVRALPAASFGAALQYFTGSKEHNVALRALAVKKGFKLSEYGLFGAAGDTLVAGAAEEDVYAALGMAWIPPELRENWGEIEAAASGRLPRLIELADIRGDFHMHTAESDGQASLEEMAAAGRALGYEYIAITDHSKALAMANGLDEKRVIAFAERVRRLDHASLGIRVLSGIECDIRKDGSMDLEEDALAALDIVIGSVHSHMNMPASEMTGRLLRALECPYLRILGHPTGRLLLRRDAYAFDLDRVAAEAARRGVFLEINASPERLDLGPELLRAAKSRGARFAISTDAHHPSHLSNMRYGVLTARRGWLEAASVLNSQPLESLIGALRPAAGRR